MKLNLYLFCSLALVLFSCKNDLKLNAPYQEIPSIYAVLNPQEKIQMIRVNKVFLGEGDANKMAQVADSVNYPAGELSITLERFVNGVKVEASPGLQTITFRDSIIQTEPGSFNTTQRIYVANASLKNIDPIDNKLKCFGNFVLTVRNNKSGNVFTSTTAGLDSIISTGYSPFQNGNYWGDPANINFLGNKGIFIDYSNESPTYALRIIPNEAVIYQTTMRLHYLDSMFTDLVKYAYVDFAFQRQNAKDAAMLGNQGPYLSNTFKAVDVLNKVASELEASSTPVASIVGRRMYRIDFIVYCTTQDYLDYLEFSAPSLSIAQEKPLYSNFDGKKALGIFAFRSRYHIAREMSNEFKTKFATHGATCKYKFLRIPDLTLNICP